MEASALRVYAAGGVMTINSNRAASQFCARRGGFSRRRVNCRTRKAGTAQSNIREHRIMPDHTYKVVELVGSSEESVTKAIDNAITKAAQTIRHLGWFEVVQVRGHIESGKVAQYQVTMKAGFRLEDD
jgi:dodecin